MRLTVGRLWIGRILRIDGRSWVRVGPRRAMATVEEERLLAEKQRAQSRTFDARPCSDATLDDLDLLRFETEYVPSATSPEIQRQNGRSTDDKLRALRLRSADGHPSNAAILLVGRDPREFFPGAYVQFLRINGPELTDPILDQKEIGGTIADQVRQIEEVMRLNIRVGTVIGTGLRQERPDYPWASLQQLVRNALLHRTYEGSTTPIRVYWYQDRIEISNPGGLYGEVTPETIWQNATAYRNPALAEGLKILGVVERFGFGLVKAKQALQANGNPPLEFEFEPNFTLFRVRAAA